MINQKINIGRLIKVFYEAFANNPSIGQSKRQQPALILKTSGATFSVIDKDECIFKIKQIKETIIMEYSCNAARKTQSSKQKPARSVCMPPVGLFLENCFEAKPIQQTNTTATSDTTPKLPSAADIANTTGKIATHAILLLVCSFLCSCLPSQVSIAVYKKIATAKRVNWVAGRFVKA